MKDLERLYEFILENYGVDIKEANRTKDVAEYRKYYYLFAQKFIKATETKIGEFVGKKRCTVVLMATDLVEIIPFNDAVRIRYNEFEQKALEVIKTERRKVKRTRHRVLRDLEYHKKMHRFFERQLEKYPPHYSEINISA